MMKPPRADGHFDGQLRQRKNRRVRFRFPVTLDVPASGGRLKTLRAHTLVVSHAGGTLDLDESVAVDTGILVTPPFGGGILAEVTDSWVDRPTGRHRISIRLIDPDSWTSPERFNYMTGAHNETLFLSPRISQMLMDYASYLEDREGLEVSPGAAAERIIEEAFLSDAKFQSWFATQIMDDLEAWEEVSVVK
jgi:hypothetical protein